MGARTLQLASVATTILGSSLIGTTFQFYYVRVFVKRYGLAQEWLDGAETSLILINLFLEPALGIMQEFGCGGMFRNRRRMILIGGPFLVGSFLLTWFPWHGGGPVSWITGTQLIVVLFCWNFWFVWTLSAYCGLYAEVSADPNDRVALFGLAMVGNLIGRSVVFPVEKASDSLHNFPLFQKLCLGLGAGGALCFAITGLTASDQVAMAPHESQDEEDDAPPTLSDPAMVDENGEDDEVALIEPEEGFSMSQAFPAIWQIFHSPSFWAAVLSNLTGGWMRSIGYANFLAIYTMLLVPSSILPQGSYQISTFFTLCQLFPIVTGAVAVISQLTNRFGVPVKRSLQAGYLLTILNAAVCLLAQPLIGDVVLIPFLFLEGVLASLSSMYTIMMGEVIDEDVRKHRRRLPLSTLIFTLNGAVVRGSIGLAPIIITAVLNTAGLADYLAAERIHPGLAPPDYLRRVALPLIGLFLVHSIGLAPIIITALLNTAGLADYLAAERIHPGLAPPDYLRRVALPLIGLFLVHSIGLAPIIITAVLNTAGLADYLAAERIHPGLAPPDYLRRVALPLIGLFLVHSIGLAPIIITALLNTAGLADYLAAERIHPGLAPPDYLRRVALPLIGLFLVHSIGLAPIIITAVLNTAGLADYLAAERIHPGLAPPDYLRRVALPLIGLFLVHSIGLAPIIITAVLNTAGLADYLAAERIHPGLAPPDYLRRVALPLIGLFLVHSIGLAPIIITALLNTAGLADYLAAERIHPGLAPPDYLRRVALPLIGLFLVHSIGLAPIIITAVLNTAGLADYLAAERIHPGLAPPDYLRRVTLPLIGLFLVHSIGLTPIIITALLNTAGLADYLAAERIHPGLAPPDYLRRVTLPLIGLFLVHSIGLTPIIITALLNTAGLADYLAAERIHPGLAPPDYLRRVALPLIGLFLVHSIGLAPIIITAVLNTAGLADYLAAERIHPGLAPPDYLRRVTLPLIGLFLVHSIGLTPIIITALLNTAGLADYLAAERIHPGLAPPDYLRRVTLPLIGLFLVHSIGLTPIIITALLNTAGLADYLAAERIHPGLAPPDYLRRVTLPLIGLFLVHSIGLAPIIITALLNTAGLADYLAAERIHPGLAPPDYLRRTGLLVATLYPALLGTASLLLISPYALPVPATLPDGTNPPQRRRPSVSESDASIVMA